VIVYFTFSASMKEVTCWIILSFYLSSITNGNTLVALFSTRNSVFISFSCFSWLPTCSFPNLFNLC